jgi:FtsP/CotA-like multicopper oxidase with cupredoxin domain
MNPLQEVWQEQQSSSCRDSVAAGSRTGKRAPRRLSAPCRKPIVEAFISRLHSPNNRCVDWQRTSVILRVFDPGAELSSLRILIFAAAMFAGLPGRAWSQNTPPEVCRRPATGSAVPEPEDLRSKGGVLRVELTYRNVVDASGQMRYCYVSKDGSQAPTLRLKPGDELILSLKNELTGVPQFMSQSPGQSAPKLATPVVAKSAGKTAQGNSMSTASPMSMPGPCAAKEMTSLSTNLHFHGLTVPPLCHQDDVLNTMIQPGDQPFEYRFKIPADEPPGLYWYHPHIHGFTKAQVLGGASGALVVEGIERANPDLAGLPERVLIVRDQDLLNPNAPPSKSDSALAPPTMLDAEGDVMNTGTGTGKPAKDLSINFVPVPYPDYRPAVIAMKPLERQLWRVLNASAITYLNLQVAYNGVAQSLGVVALDGVPINENGLSGNRVLWQTHLGVPPGGRIEFIVKGPAEGVKATLVTRSVNTGPGGENDPMRPLAVIIASEKALETQSTLAANPAPLPAQAATWLGNVQPVLTRKLFFSETLQNPDDPNSPTTFYLTVDGEAPKVFDPNSTIPSITAHQGDVEDWVIENRTQELHAFHIHQIHFMLLQWFGLPVNEPYLRDTINVPFWDGKSAVYPMVKLRMDFRDPNTVGTFVYHCHLLEHEDGGMMGLIRVEPKNDGAPKSSAISERKPLLCGRPDLVGVSLSYRHR